MTARQGFYGMAENREIEKYGFVARRGRGNRSARKGESLFMIFVGIYHPKRAQNAHYGTFGQKWDILDQVEVFTIVHLYEQMDMFQHFSDKRS